MNGSLQTDGGSGPPAPFASAREFPAYSLLRHKKFPARPRREFCRKALKSKAFSTLIFPKKAEFPAISLLRREFFPCLALPHLPASRDQRPLSEKA